MRVDWALVLVAIAVSLFVVPGFVLSSLLIRGTLRFGSTGYLGAGLIAMLPGVLMGGTGLWIAARG